MPKAGWAAFAALLAADFARLASQALKPVEAFAVFLPQAMLLLLVFLWAWAAFGTVPASLSPRPWFKAKRFGLGWTPATPEGWALVGLFVAAIVASNLALVKFRPQPPSAAALAEHLGLAAAALAALLDLCRRTGEPLGWRWGRD